MFSLNKKKINRSETASTKYVTISSLTSKDKHKNKEQQQGHRIGCENLWLKKKAGVCVSDDGEALTWL